MSVGTMIRNRSIHMPTTTQHDAKKINGIVRSFLMDRIGKGMMKLQATMSQNIGAYGPDTFDQNTGISAASFPYHVTRYSVNVKYNQNRRIAKRLFARLSQWIGSRYCSRWKYFRIKTIAINSAAMPEKMAPTTKYGPKIVLCHIGMIVIAKSQ